MMGAPRWMQGALWLCSQAYGLGLRARHLAYDRGWCKSYQAAVPVVSIGNLACGGTGKTPLVRQLAEDLANSKKVAILTRGYRSKWEGASTPRHLCVLEKLSPKECGDEPYLLARALPQVDVWVGKDRSAAALLAVAKGAEVLLLDDGMQHRRLARDVEVVVLDGKDLWGGGHLVPRGRLRDLRERLERADLVVVNHIHNATEALFAEKEVRRYCSSPVVGIQPQLCFPAHLRGQSVGAFCALGRPERFLGQLQIHGMDVVDKLTRADHRPFQARALAAFARRARGRGAVALVCTEKDAVKLPAPLELDLPLEVIGLKLEYIYGREKWEQLVEKLTL